MQKKNQYGAPGIIWRTIVMGVGYALAVIIGGAVARFVGLSTPVMPGMNSSITSSQNLFGLFLSGVLIGLIFGTLSLKLPLSDSRRVALLFITFFGINSVLIIIESLFFTTTPLSGHIHNLVSGGISWAGMSVLLTILFRPSIIDLTFGTVLREALAQRSFVSNLWRFGLAGFLYLPIFMIFGILVQPFVSTFYEDPSYGISQLFSVPAAETLFLLELVRGYLFVILVYPWIAVLGRQMGRWRQAVWVALIIASLSGWVPMLTASFLPLQFRVAHGFEITIDAIVHSLVIVWLLGVSIALNNHQKSAGDESKELA